MVANRQKKRPAFLPGISAIFFPRFVFLLNVGERFWLSSTWPKTCLCFQYGNIPYYVLTTASVSVV